MRSAILTLATLTLMAPAVARPGPCDPADSSRWAGAGIELKRLSPDDIPGLPPAIRDWLTARRFTVPQSYCAKSPNNAFRASVARTGSRDWVVLCSRADTSRILVFWDGAPDSMTEKDASPDRSHSFVCDGREFGFSRLIVPLSAANLRERYAEYGETLPEGIDHDSLEEVICEKASVVYFWRRGVVEELIGAD